MRSCVRCKCMYEKRDMLGALCPFCSQQLRPTPAQEEKVEMPEDLKQENIRLRMHVEQLMESISALTQAVENSGAREVGLRRQLHREAALAALSGYCANPLSGIAWEAAIRAADEFIRQYNPDAVIAEVVG